MLKKDKDVSKLLIYIKINEYGNEEIWFMVGNRRIKVDPKDLETVRALTKQETIEKYNFDNPALEVLESVSLLTGDKFIQSISLYRDKAILDNSKEQMFIGPIVELKVENENDYVSFIAVTNLINVSDEIKISSSFSKIDESNDFSNMSEPEILEVPVNKSDYSSNIQVILDVNAKLDGFGVYSFKSKVIFTNGFSEEHEILVPVVPNEVL